MSFHELRTPGRSRRALLPAVLLTALVALGAVPVLAAEDTGTCAAEDAAGAKNTGAQQDTLQPTRPGPWRAAAKTQPPRLRLPGTRSVMPADPMATEKTTAGRWVPGYRPATPEAQAAFEAWKKEQIVNLGTAGASGLPSSPGRNYANNLLSGGQVYDVPEEPVEHAVREEKYDVSSIDLREIEPTDEIPERKKVDRGPGFEHSSGLTWEEYNWVKEQANLAPETLEAQEASALSALALNPAGVAFDAVGNVLGYVPPDPIMAVGPTHIIAIVNSHYRVWDKSGNPLISVLTLDQFFAGVPNCEGVFDVFVDYDEANNRFVMGGETLFSGTGTDSYLCVAATATGDPTGVWHRTSFRADALVPALWIDYPHMGIGLEAIYIAGNMFQDGGNLDTVRAFAVDKTALYNGNPVTVAEASLGNLFFTAQPAKLHGYPSAGWPAPGTPHPFIAHDGGGNSRLWRWGNPFASAPVLYGTVVVPFNGVPPSARELGAATSGYNDTGDGRWMDAEYRGGKLWATRAVACNLGGGDAETCIDWAQFDVSGPAPVLEQQQTGGAFGSTGDYRYYPDLSIDRNGNVAIGYTKSSSTSYTQVWVAGREFTDPPGTLQAEILQRAGLGNYADGGGCNGNCDRWGDYTGMAVDPDGCTFWYLGEVADGGFSAWKTHIGSFRFASCSTDASVQVNKGTYTCDDEITVTVTDAIAIDAATVSARTTIATTGGDSEKAPAASWIGSDCSGSTCGTWKATLPVTSDAGTSNNGMVNAGDGQTITVVYADPHPGHAERRIEAAVACKTRILEGGYLTTGGCERGEGAEQYRDYMDGGEYISYTYGIYNPPTATALTDVEVELIVTGPAADKVTVFNPVRHLGAIDQGTLTAPVFTLYIDPSIDTAAFRLSEHAFNLRITSAADGLTAPQIVTQRHLLQTDDNIVTESQCWNFESGPQGFVEANIVDQYTCAATDCGTQAQISTTTAPWAHGGGCGSETRTDDPLAGCDTAGSLAWKSNAGAATCGNFTQTLSGNSGTLMDTVLYSPIFGPAHTGNAANGQPWNFAWQTASWYYRSDMVVLGDPVAAVAFNWDPNYPGVATPGFNEVYEYYPYTFGYLFYPNQGWDSSKPWNNDDPPANRDGVAFGNAAGAATTGLKWRWAMELYDTDYGRSPLRRAATPGLALDDLNLTYAQYHATGQTGVCQDSEAIVSFDRYSYLQCSSETLGITVVDLAAGGAAQVTVESQSTGDTETFTIYGAGPRYVGALPASTAGGPRSNDGTLLIAPSDRIRVTYHGGNGTEPQAFADVQCQGGDVVTDGLAGLTDNGDGDSYADTNETVNISIRLRNNTGVALQNVRAIIDSTDPTVDCITKNTASFGTIPAGGTGVNNLVGDPFTFKVAGSVACTDPLAPPTATFRVLILADDFAGAASPQEFTLILDLNDLSGTVTFSESFTTNPAGFQHRLGPGDDDGATTNPNGGACSPYSDRFFWRATGGNTGGGYFCWQNPADSFPNGDYGNLSDSVLYSPALKIGTAGTTLSFDHQYLFGYSGSVRVDGARVDYRVNGGVWRKLTSLSYDGPLIFNHYCNPLCNLGGEYNKPCFAETPGAGELVFNQLNLGAQNWKPASGALAGVNPGDLVQFRWRVGSMRSSDYGISTKGGYGLDNVSITGVVQRTCDATVRPDTGCGVVFDSFGNLVQRCGDGDSLVEPTERWAVDVTLRNSSAANAVNTVASLVTSGGSRNPAIVTPGSASFGTIAANGGEATATYEFTVGAGATCIEDVLFDVTDIASSQGTYRDQPSVFAVPVGGLGAQQTATQTGGPVTAEDVKASAPLTPPLTVPAPAYSATLDYDFSYLNVTPTQVEAQVVDPLVIENASTTTLLGQPFQISSTTAASAVVDWTSLNHPDVTNCTRVFLRTPTGLDWTMKAVGAAPANPYNVLSVYKNANGGAGQYAIGIQEVASGPCKNPASLAGATMTVADAPTTGSWNANVAVTLWDGAREFLIKPFGAADAPPYDISAIYDFAGPGNYAVRIEENNGGGRATISNAALSVTGIQCDAGCSVANPPAPPVADGTVGSPVRVGKGPGANELTITLDNTTCSSDRAVVLYGTIGNYTDYQAAPLGCNLGSGPTAVITAPAGSVWFNVLWVNAASAAGHPGFSTAGTRPWTAAGLCGVLSDDTSDAVCN